MSCPYGMVSMRLAPAVNIGEVENGSVCMFGSDFRGVWLDSMCTLFVWEAERNLTECSMHPICESSWNSILEFIDNSCFVSENYGKFSKPSVFLRKKELLGIHRDLDRSRKGIFRPYLTGAWGKTWTIACSSSEFFSPSTHVFIATTARWSGAHLLRLLHIFARKWAEMIHVYHRPLRTFFGTFFAQSRAGLGAAAV